MSLWQWADLRKLDSITFEFQRTDLMYRQLLKIAVYAELFESAATFDVGKNE